MTRCDVTILGAGPYGLSAAAHLKAVQGAEVRVFGEPMEFWRTNMPEGMVLRSPRNASNISDPKGDLTVDAFEAESGSPKSNAQVGLDRFVTYGTWFQSRAVPSLERKRIERVEKDGDGFRVTLRDGETFHSRRVVVAGGIGPFARRPELFAGLPPELVSHCSDGRDVKRFQGKRVAVIGGGQSALEGAALIAEAGAEVEIILRQQGIVWHGRASAVKKVARVGLLKPLLYAPTGVGPIGVSRIVSFPKAMRYLPRFVQDDFRWRCLRPSGSWELSERLKDVTITAGRRVVAVRQDSGLRLTLDDGSQRRVDHVWLATGYKVDIARYRFLSPELVDNVRRADGYPRLQAGFESSVPGLHFLGAPATWSFGPLMHFVVGTEFAGRELARALARGARPARG